MGSAANGRFHALVRKNYYTPSGFKHINCQGNFWNYSDYKKLLKGNDDIFNLLSIDSTWLSAQHLSLKYYNFKIVIYCSVNINKNFYKKIRCKHSRSQNAYKIGFYNSFGILKRRKTIFCFDSKFLLIISLFSYFYNINRLRMCQSHILTNHFFKTW